MSKFKFDWDKVRSDIEKDGKKGFEKDTRFWIPVKDDAGNGFAVLRLIPDINGNPFVKIYSHSFDYMLDGQKKWWIQNCVNTFGYDRECPICKKNSEYWNSAFESDKALASKRKRKLQFIANVYVVKHPGNPEDEGKVFLWKFGQKIYEKIKKRMFPTEQDLADDDFISFVPFDLFEGADFKLKIKKQGDFPNYDDSEFSTPKQFLGGKEDKIETVMNSTYKLDEFLAEDQFPTNEKTIQVLGTLLGILPGTDKPEENKDSDVPWTESDSEETSQSEDSILNTESPSTETTEDIDEDLEFFKNLKTQ